jgi:hypothetical protein
MRLLRTRALPWAAFVFGLGLAIVDRRTLADPTDPPPDQPPTDPSLPPEPGHETGPIHPFDPSQPDPSDVQIEDLTAEEQAYVEANMDTSAWPAIHNAYAAATTQAAEDAEAQAAAYLVGIDGLGMIGVVP